MDRSVKKKGITKIGYVIGENNGKEND